MGAEVSGPFFAARSITPHVDGADAEVFFNDERGGTLCRCKTIEQASDIATAMNRWRMERLSKAP